MSDDERSTDGSDDGASLVDFVVEDSPEDVVMDEDEDDVEAIVQESKKLTENLKSTVVGGRVLRDRSSIKKPEVYFDAENYMKVVEEADKKERLECLRKWEVSGEYKSPIAVSKKSSAEQVLEVYKAAKQALDLPDSDVETESIDEEDDDDDEDMEEEELDSDDEEEDDDEEDDEEEEDDVEDDASHCEEST